MKLSINGKQKLSILAKGGLTVFISVLVVSFIVKAGSLTPTSSPAATSYTLTDIYNRLNTNATATEGNHNFIPGASPAGTLYTLTQIYNEIPTIAADTVKSGTTYLGIAGTYDTSSLAVGTVKSGTSFGVGLTGEYPSAVNTLPNADATADLVASGSNITSSNGAVEWWQSDGTRQTATLDFPTLSNLCSTDTSNNSAGTLTVTASTIGVGNTYCGIAGTLLANLYNGSAGTNVADFAFYTQAKGGVDDYNNNETSGGLGVMPAGSYSSTWTDCSVSPYCGADSNADKKDDSTGLVWSIWLDSGTTHTWFWANNCYEPGTAENPGACTAKGDDACQCVKKTSAEVGCEALGDGNWRLPYQKELMQAYIDGSWGNLSSAGHNYWSATTISNDTRYAWYTHLHNGYTGSYTKPSLVRARCVR